MKNLIKNKYRYFIMGIFIFSFFCFNNVKAETTLTNDIKAYWKLDESSGSTAYDSVGSANGTIYGATYTTSGKINGAYSFDGSDDYISASPSITSYPITISAWVKQSANTSNKSPLSFKQSDIQRLMFGTNGTGMAYNVRDTTKEVEIGATNISGNWTFLTGVSSANNNHKFYINGELVASSNTTIAFPNWTEFRIGDFNHNSTNFHFNGYISDVSIWERALTTDEITELYNSGAGLQYPFEEEEPEDPDPEPQDPSNLGNGYIEFTGVILLLGIVIWSINQLNKIFYG